MGKSVGIRGIGFVDRELVAVVFVQTVFGADPKKALMVLHDSRNGVIGKTLLNGNLLKAQIARLSEQRGAERQPESEDPGPKRKSWRFEHIKYV